MLHVPFISLTLFHGFKLLSTSIKSLWYMSIIYKIMYVHVVNDLWRINIALNQNRIWGNKNNIRYNKWYMYNWLVRVKIKHFMMFLPLVRVKKTNKQTNKRTHARTHARTHRQTWNIEQRLWQSFKWHFRDSPPCSFSIVNVYNILKWYMALLT